MRNAIALATAALCVACTSMTGQPSGAGVVKITPLGSHDGEFCARDRALVFEDPDGTRILYDAGFTVRGTNDPRLGKIDAVLISHLHGDHLGPCTVRLEHRLAAFPQYALPVDVHLLSELVGEFGR